MAENSKIEWTHHTANLWWGCTEVHAGCDHCYAKTFSHRYDGGNSLWGADASRRRIKSTFNDLDKYQRKAKEAGEIHRVFVGSMMDIFEKPMPLLNPVDHYHTTDDLRQEFFTRITWDDGSLYPNLLFLLLTKRPSNIHKYVPAGWLDEPPKNVMYGTSVVDQETANTLVPQLLKVKGQHFFSIEPLLGPIDFHFQSNCMDYGHADFGCPGIDNHNVHWVIVGGESGHGARPLQVEWVQSIRDQCQNSQIPFLFKQWGEWAPVFDKSGNYKMWRVGKKIASNLLDGRNYLNFPINDLTHV